MLDDVYNRRILTLAANIPRLGRLENPDGTAEAVARLCGSRVTVDVRMSDGQVVDFAHDVKACALGQASASLLASLVIGADLQELQAVRDQVWLMLDQEGPPPQGKWAECGVLAPISAYRNRHASTLLTFDATLAAVRQALAADGAAAG